MSQTCALASLDLSYNQFDAYSLVQALRGNASLTSLDVRFVNGMDKLYGMLRDAIAQKDTPCRVGYLRCDAFDVLEGARVLNLKEKALGSAEMRLLLSLLRHNSAVRELDLTATDMDGEGAAALVEAIGESRKLTSVKAAYNPALDDAAKEALRAAAEQRAELTLEL